MRLKRQVLACALFVCIATAAIVVAGCGGTTQPAQKAVLAGTVVHDGTHEPLEGISIIANQQETKTAADGTWTLEVDNRDGTTVNLLAEGFQAKEVNVDGGTGQIDLGRIYLQPQVTSGRGTITGIVADAGKRVEGAQVSVGSIESVTGANGKYTLYNVPEGRQDVMATTGQKYGYADVVVIEQRTVEADIAVSSNPPTIPF